MPECANCGAFVTSDYVRVFTPDDVDDPRVCPHCEDMIRGSDGIREKKG